MVSNREELMAQSKIFRHHLRELERLLASGDSQALEGLIEQASQTRAHWRMTQRQD